MNHFDVQVDHQTLLSQKHPDITKSKNDLEQSHTQINEKWLIKHEQIEPYYVRNTQTQSHINAQADPQISLSHQAITHILYQNCAHKIPLRKCLNEQCKTYKTWLRDQPQMKEQREQNRTQKQEACGYTRKIRNSEARIVEITIHLAESHKHIQRTAHKTQTKSRYQISIFQTIISAFKSTTKIILLQIIQTKISAFKSTTKLILLLINQHIISAFKSTTKNFYRNNT